MANMKGQTIRECYVKYLPQEKQDPDDKYSDVRDIHYYTIQGNKSYVHFVLYVDHNGYYGGSLVLDEYDNKKGELK